MSVSLPQTQSKFLIRLTESIQSETRKSNPLKIALESSSSTSSSASSAKEYRWMCSSFAEGRALMECIQRHGGLGCAVQITEEPSEQAVFIQPMLQCVRVGQSAADGTLRKWTDSINTLRASLPSDKGTTYFSCSSLQSLVLVRLDAGKHSASELSSNILPEISKHATPLTVAALQAGCLMVLRINDGKGDTLAANVWMSCWTVLDASNGGRISLHAHGPGSDTSLTVHLQNSSIKIAALTAANYPIDRRSYPHITLVSNWASSSCSLCIRFQSVLEMWSWCMCVGGLCGSIDCSAFDIMTSIPESPMDVTSDRNLVGAVTKILNGLCEQRMVKSGLRRLRVAGTTLLSARLGLIN